MLTSAGICLVFVAATTIIETFGKMPSNNINQLTFHESSNLDPVEKEKQYWIDNAHTTLNRKLVELNKNKAKNVILFMGDGLSVTTITAARIYQGQMVNKSGEEQTLPFESFPHTGLSKTYCVNSQVADSACSATAFLTGVKTNFRAIGVTATANISDCAKAKIESNRLSSILKWAQDIGKSTGIVTNTRVTHASPAGAYAHVPYRGMECDADTVRIFGEDYKDCDFDIAQQLITEEPGKNFQVIMGGGRNKFLPKVSLSPLHGLGSRLKTDLVSEWKKDKEGRAMNATYVTNLYDLDKVDVDNTEYLLGLFALEHMSYNSERNQNEPTLTKMTEMAIKILRKNENGFVLFVEGGKIDMAHHEAQARRSLDETVEFANAIQNAVNMTSEQDTLIVVTADHAHTMSMSGYPVRGSDILGSHEKASDELLYSTLSYANGPGYRKEEAPGVRHNLSLDDMKDFEYRFPGLAPREKETHGGDDVAVYARGPWSHLFSGNYEQNYIPIAMAYAAQIPLPSSKDQQSNFSEILNVNYFLIVTSALFLCKANILIF